VRRDALRANEVVRRLRRLLEQQAVEFGPVDLSDVVEETLVLLEPEAVRRRVVIERQLPGTPAPVLGDRVQLQQVVLNLCINAMDAMQDTPGPQRVLSVSLRRVGDGFQLAVSDRGHGFAPGAQGHLFESFFTTKPHGMGLGLAIVRTVVDAHRGWVHADARSGGGSVFTVWLAARSQPREVPLPVGGVHAA
jgi:signal transduction histidine kinase